MKFLECERGLFATHTLNERDVVISIHERLMITADSVIDQSGYLNAALSQ